MTSARELKLLFIAYVSFNLSPSTFVKLSRSDPAKSTRESVMDFGAAVVAVAVDYALVVDGRCFSLSTIWDGSAD